MVAFHITGSKDIAEASSSNTKVADADEDVGVGDEVLDELCDKITLAAGVTAKDKRLKDALTESLLREENIKRIKKTGDKGTTESGKSSDSRMLLQSSKSGLI